MVKEILQLGNPALYNKCEEVKKEELNYLKEVVSDLHDTLMNFRNKYNAGRAIAAPQIGVFKRLVYMNIDQPLVFINPLLSGLSEDTFELWDDCMSFPDLLVRVRRHQSCTITFRNMEWAEQKLYLEGDLSELLQHETDHLDGILAISRAIDQYSFSLRNALHLEKSKDSF
jgi:peptide deformylase